jgi:O-antigen/teichoic acid export membrane protein
LFKITDQTKYSFYFTLTGALVTLIAIFTLIPIFGYMGGALSTFLCYLSMCILCLIYGQKIFPIPYQIGKGTFYLTLAFISSYIGLFIDLENQWLDFILKNTMVLGFVVVVLYLEKVSITQLKQSFTR